MSAIPPNPLASLIQVHAAGKRASEARAAEQVGEAARASPFHGAAPDAVQNEDRDAQVDVDGGGGGGGNGRARQGTAEERRDDEPTDPAAPDGGVDVVA